MTKNGNKRANKKKWLILGIVSTALLLIPRRSSKQAACNPENRPLKNSE